MALDLFAKIDNNINATRWRSLQLYNAYRFLIAVLFLVLQGLLSGDKVPLNLNSNLLQA